MTETAVQPQGLLGRAMASMQLPKSRTKCFFLFLLSVFFTYAGFHHLFVPDFYVSIMPPWIPAHLALVYISGVRLALQFVAFYWAYSVTRPDPVCAA